MNQNGVSIYAVGDLHPNRDNPESALALAAPTLKEADIRFGQLETNFSDKRTPQVWRSGDFVWIDPENVRALTSAGFDLVSFASNHTLNLGEDAFFDTLDLLRRKGIAVIGAGKDIDAARKPAIIERKGTRIAFLAYCSVLPEGYEARPNKPGVAPMRASAFYEPVSIWNPGVAPRVITLANKQDLEAMREDIRKVRPLADVVVMSIHCGIPYAPAIIAMYQKEVGYAAIDAGVDLILGHHAHMLKGIEVYKGKVIFYSLGNFAFDFPIEARRGNFFGYYNGKLDPEYPTYGFPPDSRKTMIAKCVIANKRIEIVSFFPAMVNKKGQPEVLPLSDKRALEVTDYVEWCCRDQKLDTRFSQDGDEVVIN